MKYLIQILFGRQSIGSPLGRWCHPLYSKLCNSEKQMVKGYQADADNSLCAFKVLGKKPNTDGNLTRHVHTPRPNHRNR